MVSTGNSRMKWMTLRAIEFTWPGVPVTAWASMRPSRSNTPAEMSPASRALVGKAWRGGRWPPAGGPAPRRRRAGGSTSPAGGYRPKRSWGAYSCHILQHDLAQGIDAGAEALRHDGGGAILDDQRRPVERHAGAEHVALMQGGVLVPAGGRVQHLAVAAWLWRGGFFGNTGGLGPGPVGGDREGPGQRLDLELGNGAAEHCFVSRLEAPAQVGRSVGTEGLVGQRHGDLVALAAIAHEGQARLG